MTEVDAPRVDKRFYLDGLHVGQRFVSRTHLIDAEQIKAFAGQFDPQPFHLDEELAKETLFGGLAASGWHTAAITMRLLVEGGLPLVGGILGAGGDIAWPIRRGPATRCELKARSWLSRLPSRGLIAASQPCAAGHTIKRTRWCKSSRLN